MLRQTGDHPRVDKGPPVGSVNDGPQLPTTSDVGNVPTQSRCPGSCRVRLSEAPEGARWAERDTPRALRVRHGEIQRRSWAFWDPSPTEMAVPACRPARFRMRMTISVALHSTAPPWIIWGATGVYGWTKGSPRGNWFREIVVPDVAVSVNRFRELARQAMAKFQA